ncbi:MAG: hypothetical protein HOP23_05615 [Methylococcaceae bacterium]|nr:hypothetical protein [Methylococcaceae bacterium]NOT11297.1 hypothetical protein [Methylococcaceae bacterium]
MNIEQRIARLEDTFGTDIDEVMPEGLSAQEQYMILINRTPPRRRSTANNSKCTMTPEEAYRFITNGGV